MAIRARGSGAAPLEVARPLGRRPTPVAAAAAAEVPVPGARGRSRPIREAVEPETESEVTEKPRRHVMARHLASAALGEAPAPEAPAPGHAPGSSSAYARARRGRETPASPSAHLRSRRRGRRRPSRASGGARPVGPQISTAGGARVSARRRLIRDRGGKEEEVFGGPLGRRPSGRGSGVRHGGSSTSSGRAGPLARVSGGGARPTRTGVGPGPSPLSGCWASAKERGIVLGGGRVATTGPKGGLRGARATLGSW